MPFEGIWLIVLLIVALTFVTRPSIHGNDGVQNYVYLRSLLFDGDFDFTNEYRHYFGTAPEWFDHKDPPRDPVTGKPINLYGVGNALLWAPWVFAFHGLGLIVEKLGVEIALDGYGKLYQWAVGVGSAFYASVGLFLLFLFLRNWVSTRVAFWTVLFLWLGTPLFFYSHIHPSMSHANSFFLSTLLVYLWWGRRFTRRHAFALGTVAGLLALTRFQDAVLLVPLALVEFLRWWHLLRRRWAWNFKRQWVFRRLQCWGCFLVAMVAICSLQCFAWAELHGSPVSGPRGYLSQGQVDLLRPRHALQVLLSPFHGLLHWHPLLIFGLIGLCFRMIPPRLRLAAATAFLVQVWIVGSWSIWWAGASFGHRMFISTFPWLALGTAAIWEAWNRRHRWLIPSIVAVALLWNFGLVVQYAARIIPRQAPVSILTLGKNMRLIPSLLLGGRQEKTGPKLENVSPQNSN